MPLVRPSMLTASEDFKLQQVEINAVANYVEF